MANIQKAFSFDSESMKKIGKGLLYAVVPAAGIAFFEYVGTIQVDSPILASFIVWAVPAGVNALKEWASGGKE